MLKHAVCTACETRKRGAWRDGTTDIRHDWIAARSLSPAIGSSYVKVIHELSTLIKKCSRTNTATRTRKIVDRATGSQAHCRRTTCQFVFARQFVTTRAVRSSFPFLFLTDDEDGPNRLSRLVNHPRVSSEIPSATVMYMRVLAIYGKRFRFKYWKMSVACIQER